MPRPVPAPRPAPAPALVPPLVDWFVAHARPMPWRSDPTPYKVLLSELMLQQTRVQTVVDRFHDFVTRWPTLQDLAAAREDEVLEAWAGLGYYRRARHLHRAARQAVSLGGLPSDPKALQELPGIGPYTAGAIASIAFGRRAPLVDGNVERVLSRVDGRHANPRKARGRRALWSRAGELVQHGDPSQVNQGLMELGATVCTPSRPDCPRCPWRATCVARDRGEQEQLPRLPKKKKPTPIRGATGLLWCPGGLVMGQRPDGLLGGTWEPVSCDLKPGDNAPGALVQSFADRVGVTVEVGERLGEITHLFSHRRLRLEVYAVTGQGTPRCLDHYRQVRVVDPDRSPGDVAISTLVRKVLHLGPRR